MKNIISRIQELEKRFMPAPQTAFGRQLMARIEAGRRRNREYNEAHGIPPISDEGLPPKKVHTSRGAQRIMDVLHEGRDRSRLRAIRDGKVYEPTPSTIGGN